MSRTVLVPVDGSPLSFDALRHACREFPDAEVVAYHVVDLFRPDYGTLEDVDSTYEPMIGTAAWDRAVEEATDKLFADVSAIADEYDRSVVTDSDIGDPKRLIVEYATVEDIDHVVLGSHGRLDDRRPLYGSVTETVVRRVPVPVTVIR